MEVVTHAIADLAAGVQSAAAAEAAAGKRPDLCYRAAFGTYRGTRIMALDEIMAAMESQADKLKELNHTILFDLGDDGRVLLDASGDEVKLTPNPDSDDADTTLTLSAANLAKLMEGDLNPMVAFTMGRLKISGSKGVALKLSSLLDK
jgi:putative sterol carrier protein